MLNLEFRIKKQQKPEGWLIESFQVRHKMVWIIFDLATESIVSFQLGDLNLNVLLEDGFFNWKGNVSQILSDHSLKEVSIPLNCSIVKARPFHPALTIGEKLVHKLRTDLVILEDEQHEAYLSALTTAA